MAFGNKINRTVIEHFANKEKQEIRKLKARITIAEVELEQLRDELSQVERSLEYRHKELEAA